MGPNVSLSMRVLIDLMAGLLFERLFGAELFFEELAMAARATGDTGAKPWGTVRGRAPLFLAEAVEPHDLAAAGWLAGAVGRVLGGIGIGRGRHRRHAGRHALVLRRWPRGAALCARRTVRVFGFIGRRGADLLELQAELNRWIEEALH